MSWFDATALTSYAKTALASAQKSIDKVLDIDEEGGGSSQATKTTSKGKGDQVEKLKPLQTSTPKPSSTSSPLRSSSKEKLTVKNDTLEASGGDFWSSFLGTPEPSPSSTNKTFSAKKSRSRDTLTRKTSDSKLTVERKSKKENTATGKDVGDCKDLDSVTLNKEGNEKNNETNNEKGSVKDNNKTKDNQNYKDINFHEQSNTDDNLVSKKSDSPEKTQEIVTDITSRSSTKVEQNKSNISGNTSTDGLPSQRALNTDHSNDSSVTKLETTNVQSDIVEKIDNSEHKTEGNSKELNQHIQVEIQTESTSFNSELETIELSSGNSENNVNPEISQKQDDSNNESSLESTDVSAPFFSDERLSRSAIESACFNTSNDTTEICSEARNVEEESNVEVHMKEPVEHKDEAEEASNRKEPTEDECTQNTVVKGVMLEFVEEDGEFNDESVTSDFKFYDIIDDSSSDQKQEEPVEPVQDGEQRVELTAIEKTKEAENEPESDGPGDENNVQIQNLTKEISHLKELVNARENKMVSLSKENIDYQETVAILTSQIDQLESMQAGDNEEFEQMREEFTTRMATAENKYHEAADERDQLKTELEETTAHLTDINSRQKEEYTTLISEKDEQIAQLLTEGEKLSKQELQSNTVIKKLRAKEKENEALIKKQTNKLEEYTEEVKRLTDILTSRDDSNSKQGDAIIQLNTYVKKQEEKLSKQTSELDDASEKLRSMQVALDNAYKEMTSLQKQTASTDSTIKGAVLSTEMKAKEDLRIAIEKTRREYQQESEMMALQVTDLQTSLTRNEQQSTRREENLRQEIKELQQRLQEAEDRNQELATSVSHATRPLLRQIENLQTTHNGQASTWEKVEKTLTDRLNDAQNQLLKAQEKERTATRGVAELNGRITRLESQVNTYRAERSRLEADLELERTKLGTLEDATSRETAKYDAMVKKYQKLIEDGNLDKAHLEQQLTVEKSKMDTELKKLKSALDDKEKLLSRQSSFSGIPPPSTNGEWTSQQQDTTGIPSARGHSRTSSSSSSVVDSFAKGFMGSSTALVERLQAQIRQKDGEIELLQDDVTSLRQSRDSVMEELTSMNAKLESLETSHEQYKELKEKYDALQQRYNAVLQMYGEKEEEAEELRMDLHDVKSMYKQQLEQLFGSR